MTEFTKVQDSGARQEFGTGSVRDTREGKGRFDLIPPYPLTRLARHYENGAEKYGDWNWSKGQPLMRYFDSCLRHINKHLDGSQDEDHLAAAAWNLFSIIHTEEMIRRGVLPHTLDDRPQWAVNSVVAPPGVAEQIAKAETADLPMRRHDGIFLDRFIEHIRRNP